MLLLKVVGGVLVVYVILCLVMVWQERNLVYFPTRGVSITPDRVGLQYEDVRIDSAPGVRLQAWVVRAHGRDRPWVLFCHGNGGNLEGGIDVLKFFHKLVDANAMVFDYRGYGLSTGQPDEAGLYQDTEACWQWVQRQNPASVFIMGESLGAGPAIWLAQQHPPAGLIVQSAFTSVPDMGARTYWFMPVRLLARTRFPNIERVPALHCPKLFIHSPQDDIIPFDFGQQLFAAAAEPKRFYQTTGLHNTSPLAREPAYAKAISDFIHPSH